MKKAWVILACLCVPAIAGATVTSTASTAPFTCSNTTGPFPFTFPALNTGALQVTEQNPADPLGVMTVLASNQWAATPVNNSYANGGSITLVTACPTGYTLTIVRTTETTQLTAYTPYMPALYANVESNVDQLSTSAQDVLRLDQVHMGAVTGNGIASVTQTPLGQYLSINFPDAGTGGPFCPLAGCSMTGTITAPNLRNVVNIAAQPYNAVGDSPVIAGGVLTIPGSNKVITNFVGGEFLPSMNGMYMVVNAGGQPYTGNSGFDGQQLIGYAKYISAYELDFFSDAGLTTPLNAGQWHGDRIHALGTSSDYTWASPVSCVAATANNGPLTYSNNSNIATCHAVLLGIGSPNKLSCVLDTPGSWYSAVPVVTVTATHNGVAGSTFSCPVTMEDTTEGYGKGTDNTAAIQQAWADSFATGKPLYIPGGTPWSLTNANINYGFWYGQGVGLAGGNPYPVVLGDGAKRSLIVIDPASYFIDDNVKIGSMNIDGISFYGGIGAIRENATGGFTKGSYVISNSQFWSFTGTALAMNLQNNPFWHIFSNYFRGANSYTTMDLYLSSEADNSLIENNGFEQQRIGLASPFFSTVHAINNDFLHSHREPVDSAWLRTEVWMGAADSTYEQNPTNGLLLGSYATDFSGSKYGNERESQTDINFLVANQPLASSSTCNDGTSNCPMSNRYTWLTTPSAALIYNNHWDHIIVNGAGNVGQVLVYSYAPPQNVYLNTFYDIEIPGGPMPWSLYFDPSVLVPTLGSSTFWNFEGSYHIDAAHMLNPGLVSIGGSNQPGSMITNDESGASALTHLYNPDPQPTSGDYGTVYAVDAAQTQWQNSWSNTLSTITNSQNIPATAAQLNWDVNSGWTGFNLPAWFKTGYTAFKGNVPVWLSLELQGVGSGYTSALLSMGPAGGYPALWWNQVVAVPPAGLWENHAIPVHYIPAASPTITATAYSFNAGTGILTLTGANTAQAGEWMIIAQANGADPLFALNTKAYQILSTGLSGTQVQIATTLIAGSGLTTGTTLSDSPPVLYIEPQCPGTGICSAGSSIDVGRVHIYQANKPVSGSFQFGYTLAQMGLCFGSGPTCIQTGAAAPTGPCTIGYRYVVSGTTSTWYRCIALPAAIVLSAAANASGGNTQYTAAIPVGMQAWPTSTYGTTTIGGFATGANNGSFTIISTGNTTITVNNNAGVSQTNTNCGLTCSYAGTFSTTSGMWVQETDTGNGNGGFFGQTQTHTYSATGAMGPVLTVPLGVTKLVSMTGYVTTAAATCTGAYPIQSFRDATNSTDLAAYLFVNGTANTVSATLTGNAASVAVVAGHTVELFIPTAANTCTTQPGGVNWTFLWQ